MLMCPERLRWQGAGVAGQGGSAAGLSEEGGNVHRIATCLWLHLAGVLHQQVSRPCNTMFHQAVGSSISDLRDVGQYRMQHPQYHIQTSLMLHPATTLSDMCADL